MIGATKIDSKTDDLKRLGQYFRDGYNNVQISKLFTTNSGEKLSTEHIRQIRNGRRWNSQLYSFIEKQELKNPEQVVSSIGMDVYRTEIGIVLSNTLDLYILLTYKNDILVSDSPTSLLTEKPSINEILEYHKKHLV